MSNHILQPFYVLSEQYPRVSCVSMVPVIISILLTYMEFE